MKNPIRTESCCLTSVINAEVEKALSLCPSIFNTCEKQCSLGCILLLLQLLQICCISLTPFFYPLLIVFKVLLNYWVCVRGRGCVCFSAPSRVRESQRATSRGQFSLSIMWVPGPQAGQRMPFPAEPFVFSFLLLGNELWKYSIHNLKCFNNPKFTLLAHSNQGTHPEKVNILINLPLTHDYIPNIRNGKKKLKILQTAKYRN